jgi:SRSO17 transposase
VVPRSSSAWQREFERWLAPFLAALGHKARRRWAPVYLEGLLGPGERKSVAPLAARVAPADTQQLHHFVCASAWDPAPLEAVLVSEATRLVGGPDAVLIVDDTTLLKQGRHSVGVARQYSGQAGKTANCQTLVSLTLARGEVPVCVGVRLYLPRAWTDAPGAPARCRRAGVPRELRRHRTREEIALAELDRVLAEGARFGLVLADLGYGRGAAFRRGLSARGLRWAVGVPANQKVYPATVRLLPPRRGARGRPCKYPVPSAPRVAVDALLAASPIRWRRVSWRLGTKGRLSARFAAVRVCVADGPANAENQHLPGEVVWLVGEERASGERKYYLTNHPPGTGLRTLAAAIKARWVCEQAHQQLKEELGLDHFEGRSWAGLHHHALLAQIAFAFLQHLRLRELRSQRAQRGGEKTDAALARPLAWAPARADAADRPASAPRAPRPARARPLSALPPSHPARAA